MQPCLNVVRSNVNCIRKKLRPFVGVDPAKAAFIEPFSLHSCQQLYFFLFIAHVTLAFWLKSSFMLTNTFTVGNQFWNQLRIVDPGRASILRTVMSVKSANCIRKTLMNLESSNPRLRGLKSNSLTSGSIPCHSCQMLYLSLLLNAQDGCVRP